MESNDRQMILSNIEQLMRYTEYQNLINKCQERRLLSNVMVQG